MSDLLDRVATSLGRGFIVQRELSGGGMSHVFLAHDATLGRNVVIKLVPWELSDESQTERFRQEISIAARLQHPHIVPLLAAGEIEGRPYYTMPFVEGDSLRARLRSGGELPVKEAVRILRDVALALEYAHQHGVVHRDIKPDNILLTDGVAVVTDFGVAKAVAAMVGDEGLTGFGLTPLGSALGTPAYMAPEQAVGDEHVDSRADIYSLGCLGYEMLTGLPPFRRSTAQATIAAHLTETPVSLSIQRPAAAGTLSKLLMQCLEKRPADRPQSAREIIASLDQISASLAIGVATGSASGTQRRRMADIPAAVRIAGAVIGAAVLVAFWVRTSMRASPDRRVLAIMPVRLDGAEPEVRQWRERLLYLVEDKMARGHSARTVDSHALLKAWHDAGGNDTTDLSRADELQVARAVGAGRLLVPSLMTQNEVQTFRATIVDVGANRPSRSATAVGPSDSIPSMVDRVIAELLALEANEEAAVASALASTSLPALDAYLNGRTLYRAGRMSEAQEAFLSALELDPTFALAGYYLVQTAWWPEDDGAMRTRGWDVASAHGERLPVPHRLRLILETGRDRPAPALGIDGLRAMDSLRRLAPHSPETWASIGDWFFHWGSVVGIRDAEVRALEGLGRALALDSSFGPVLLHLPLVYWEHGDTAATRRALNVMARLDTTASGREIQELHMAAFLGDSAEGARVFGKLALAKNRATLNTLMGMASLTGRYLDIAEIAAGQLMSLSITPRERSNAIFNVARHELIVGHPTHAARLRRERSEPRARGRDLIIDFILHDGDSAAAVDGVRDLSSVVDALPVGTHRSAQWARDVFILAEGRIALGDTAGARRLVDALRNATFQVDQKWLPAERDRYLVLIAAQLAPDRSPESHRLTVQADSSLRSGMFSAVNTMTQAEFYLSIGNLAVARLWDRLGDTERALAAIRREPRTGARGRPGAILYEHARLSALAGQRAEAIEMYRYYLAARAYAEPLQQAKLAQVRSELVRLERERG